MTCYEDYPIHIVVFNLVLLLAALVAGVLLVAQLDWWAVLLYVLVGFLGVFLSLAFGCTRCHYYGKVCGMGLGKIAPLFFGRRAESEFGRARSQTIAWTLVGLVLALPLAAGLVALSSGPLLPGLAVLVVFLGLVIVVVLTHSRFVCGRCHQWKERRCTLGRLARSL